MSVPPLPGKAIPGVYRGYMPIGLPQHRPRNTVKPWMAIKGKPRYTLYPKKELEGYSQVAEYPALTKGMTAQIRYDWYKKLKQIPTVESKMYEILRHSNHHMAHTTNYIQNYNSLPLAQYLTQTRLINELPQDDNNMSFSRELIDDIKDMVLDQIAVDKHHTCKVYPSFEAKKYFAQTLKTREQDQIVQNIYNRVKRRLALETNPQLIDYQHDLEPSINSWWYHSGFVPPNDKVFYKSRKDEDGNINQIIQMRGGTALNLRSTGFLRPIVSLDDPLVTELNAVEKHSYPLKTYGFNYKFSWPVMLAGHWFFENSKRYDNIGYNFPHTTFLSAQCLQVREHRSDRVVKPLSDHADALLTQAIMTGFGWMNGVAMYHGFTPFDEVEYPFTCQVITTDGKNWLFNIYQLNCHSFHRDFGGPQRNNICWSSGLMQLYEDFDGSNYHGVNEDVIKLLVRLLSQQTSVEYTDSLKLMPLLDIDQRTHEEIKTQNESLLKNIEQRRNRYLLHDWNVPLWEHTFFRHKVMRNRIKELKPRYHIPKHPYPKIFE